VYSEADRHSLHVREADEAVLIGPAPPAQSYLDGERILRVARETGAGAIHPGYGFLSENADFAQRCEAAGIAFAGPTPQQIRDFGLKHRAREFARAADLPMLPGTELLDHPDHAVAEARRDRLSRSCSRAPPAVAESACSSAATRPACARPGTRCSAWRRTTSRTPACSWRSTSSTHATSRYRSSATAAAK
jgi:biotin carboxylase